MKSYTITPQSIKEILQRAVAPIKGVKPTFNEYHVIKFLLVLHKKEPLGRQLLSKYLGLSITSIRTLTKRLKILDLINIDPVAGCTLTEYGRELVNKILNIAVKGGEITNVLDNSLLLYGKAYVFLIKKGLELIKHYDVSYLRDTVIKNKAKAAIIVYVMEGKAYIPPYTELDENRFPSLRKIRNLLNAVDFDIIIVIFAENENVAEEAFFITLLDLSIL
ncbi:MAG: DUF4443 domain-containing protein [Ignisphaera sp.]|uniref:DUF4443 domain-containing protein n=1 Tax=Ignisphaera aggregans TaxID=334771 RepID=A0A7C4NN47_9CREN